MKGIEWFDEINIYLYTCTSQTNIVQKSGIIFNCKTRENFEKYAKNRHVTMY